MKNKTRSKHSLEYSIWSFKFNLNIRRSNYPFTTIMWPLSHCTLQTRPGRDSFALLLVDRDVLFLWLIFLLRVAHDLYRSFVGKISKDLLSNTLAAGNWIIVLHKLRTLFQKYHVANIIFFKPINFRTMFTSGSYDDYVY